MKKLLVIMMALVMCLSIAACGNSSDAEGSTSDSEVAAVDTSNIDFGEMFAGKGDEIIIWSEQDEATKKAIIDAAKKEGYEASFSADGSLVMYDPVDKVTFTQAPDGSWKMSSENGDSVYGAKTWPDHELAKLIPQPKFEVSASGSDDETVTVQFKPGAALDDIKAYAEEIKKAGFDENIQEVEYDDVYVFTANDKNGNEIVLTCRGDQTMLAVSKN